MEQTQESLFGLSIDTSSRAHLAEAGRWAKFLAIVGMVLCILFALLGLFFSSILSGLSRGPYGNGYSSPLETTGMAGTVGIIYLFFAALGFMAYLFLYRFATKMKVALAGNDQDTLNASFQNLKIMFRYVGILTIIVLSIYALILLFVLAGAGLGRM